jgi:hypothetical protein
MPFAIIGDTDGNDFVASTIIGDTEYATRDVHDPVSASRASRSASGGFAGADLNMSLTHTNPFASFLVRRFVYYLELCDFCHD